MLTELRVRDFAIIDDLLLRFQPGFNILTGETGAGKSIIIDAVELLLGAKSSQEMVRAGADIASIEGLFELDAAIGQGANDSMVQYIAAQAHVRVGGGVRTAERARQLVEEGAKKVIVGTAAFSLPR